MIDSVLVRLCLKQLTRHIETS